MEINNQIIIDELDSNTLDEIYDSIDNLKNRPGDQHLGFDMKSLTGDIHDSLDITEAVHSADNVHIIPIASGNAGIAGTILTAAGKPGFREAKFGTKFSISKDGPYPQGTAASGLSNDDKTIYDTLSSLTGKRKAVLAHIVKGTPLSTNEAKKCRIIDNVLKFQSKYKRPKNRTKSAIPSAPSTQSNTTPPAPTVPIVDTNPAPQENQNIQSAIAQLNQNQPVAPAPGRGRRKKK